MSQPQGIDRGYLGADLQPMKVRGLFSIFGFTRNNPRASTQMRNEGLLVILIWCLQFPELVIKMGRHYITGTYLFCEDYYYNRDHLTHKLSPFRDITSSVSFLGYIWWAGWYWHTPLNPAREAETVVCFSVSSTPAWSTERVPGQAPKLHRETLFRRGGKIIW